MPKQPDDEDYTPEQAAQRRDDVLRRMLATPPQPRPKPAAHPKRGKQAKPSAP